MNPKKLSGIMLALLLTSMLTFAFNTPYVKATGSWVLVRDTVTGAWGEAVVGTGDAIYVARKTSFYRYTTVDNSWTALAAPSNPDSGDAFKTGTALAWDFSDYIYALYGAAEVDSRKWFYRYSISGNSWQALANTPAYQGEGDAITYNGTYIYATIGGEQRSTYFVRYDPSTNSWSDEPADPPAGMGDGASLVWTGGDFLYALRGEFDETTALYDFWRYSLTDDVWVAMADIPADPHDGGEGGVGDGGSLLSVGFWLSDYTDYIYALSGNQVNEIRDNCTYRYTISMNSWERLTDLPFEVGYYVGCRLGYADGNIYAWQGAPSTWAGGGDELARYELPIRSPVASFTENATTVLTGEAISFDASSSSDPDGSIASYSWDFGDGANATGITTSHSYADDGTYTVTLTVMDDDGASGSANATKTVLNRSPVASFTESAESVYINETISFNASASYDPDGSIVSYFWTFGDGSNATGVTTSHSYTALGNYTVTLTVTDDDGASNSANATKTVLHDSTSPMIEIPSRMPSGDYVQPEQTVEVSVNVTDAESGVKNVTLFYTMNNGTSWANRTMNYNSSTNLYETTISRQPVGTRVKFKVVAYDYAGNNATKDGTEPHCTYQVVPEFPSNIVFPLFMVLTMLTVLYVKKRVLTNPKN